MSTIVELTPTGTTTIDEKPSAKTTEAGVHVIRESIDMLLWHGAKLVIPEVDYSEAGDDLDQLPEADRHIQFGMLRDPRIQVILPIPVEVSREEDGTVVAAWTEAEEYGHGRDRSEALEDFGRTVSQLFISLSREENGLGNDMRRVLALLKSHMSFRASR